MRKIATFAIAMMTILSLALVPIPISAAMQNSEIVEFQPFWDTSTRVSPMLSGSGNTAFANVTITGRPGTTQILATITLSRVAPNGSLTTVRTWANQGVSGSHFSFSGSNAVTSGNTYRLTVSANVTRDGVTEHVSGWTERRF